MNYTRGGIQRGYTNRILSVDLSTGKITTPGLDTKIRDYFLGGRSLGLYLLHQAITSRTRPDDPENPLIIANGPLGGIPQFPGTAKAMGLSVPMTGFWRLNSADTNLPKIAGLMCSRSGIASRDVVIIINAYKSEVTIEESPSDEEAFDLERDIAERLTSAGYDKRHIAFLSTGIGAANTNYGCINSHYFDVTKPVDGHRGLFRVKQAGRTGIGTVMSRKRIQSIIS
jgi:aldehyde:ferredoxin oxidoreductase